MRRKDREITDFAQITEIIDECLTCRLGFCDGEKPYVVPMSFGYKTDGEKRIFYFHGAKTGRKIDLINKNHFACIELDTGYKIIEGETACDYSAKYKSVIGSGKIMIIEDNSEKTEALSLIMKKSTGKADWKFPAVMLGAVCVYKLELDEISAKEHK